MTVIDLLEYLKKMNTVGRRLLGEEVESDLNPRISIQIVPFGLGPYRAMRQAFEIIELRGEGESWMMYFEIASGSQVIRDQYDDIADYIDRFSVLSKALPGPNETNRQIDSIIQQMHNSLNGAQ